MAGLLAIDSTEIERTGPLKSEDAVADHFGPDPEMSTIDEPACGHVGDLPDAELKSGAVIGKASDLFTDALFCLTDPSR